MMTVRYHHRSGDETSVKARGHAWIDIQSEDASEFTLHFRNLDTLREWCRYVLAASEATEFEESTTP